LQSKYVRLATDAYCLLNVYDFLCVCLQKQPDYLESFRGKKIQPNQQATTTTTGTIEPDLFD